MLTDTHAHLDFPDFADDLSGVLRRASEAGVSRIISIGTSVESSRRAIALAEQHENVFAVIGVHPNAAGEAEPDFAQHLRELAQHPRVAAIGECGLDYHRLPSRQSGTPDGPLLPALGNAEPLQIEGMIADGAVKSQQAAVFEQQLELASELRLNVVIHERDAWDDTLEILRAYTGRLRAVFHCFGKGPEQAREVLALGHLVSFTGIATFKNAAVVHASAAEVPAGSFMLETDCPFLAPVPQRGKRCEPAHVRIIAEHIAGLRNVPLKQLAAETTKTAEQFFRLE
jgi:TatD DNase family protein